MGKNIWIIFGAIIILIIGSVFFLDSKKVDESMMEKDNNEMMKDEGVMMNTGEDAIKDDTSMMDDGDKMMKAGSYESYKPEKVTLASATHDVVLFFRASWCPTCKALDSDIKANLSKVPQNLSILDVDYDNSSSLKQKYGVTYQHTLVQVDKDGNLIKKWTASPTLASLVSQVQ